MLSAETATGEYPVESVATMARIIEKMEGLIGVNGRAGDDKGAAAPGGRGDGNIRYELGTGVYGASHRRTDAHPVKGDRVLTHSGRTARMIARYRPSVPIVALTDYMPVIRRMSLVWGVQTIPVESIEETERIFPIVKEKLSAAGFSGKIVITAGIPTMERTPTNTIHVFEV